MELPPDFFGLTHQTEAACIPVPSKPSPAEIGKNPGGVLVFERINVMRGIILWLAGVPLVVIIGLYLFHVI